MSWIKENYQKAVLGIAVLLFIGISYVGSKNYNSVDEDFGKTAIGRGSDDIDVKHRDVVATAKSSFELDRKWIRAETPEGRSVDLFTGVALFVNKNDQDNPVDLISGEPVHPPIPNSWWIENRIDPGFGNSPQLDEDKDGFSNLEEFLAKTSPTDPLQYPPLITKLTYAGDESVEWTLRPGFESAGGSFTFTYFQGKLNNRVSAASPIPPGGVFFDKEPAKGRFKLIGSEKRKVRNEAIGADIEVSFVKVEDQHPHKKAVVYEIPASFQDRDRAKFAHFDRTAVFSLEALGLAGREFKVEENDTFSLPPGGENKPYKVTKVTAEQVSIEFTGVDGKIETYEIRQGAKISATP